MNTQMTLGMRNPLTVKRTLGILTAAAALAVPSLALADVPVTMAPPVDQSSSSYNSYNSDGSYSGVNGNSNSYNNSGNVASSAATSSVFSWQEIPTNQRVPIQRAVFDQGGYQLYDTVGETIAVPFANNNLYVMKFAVSPDGSTYFINDGNSPILFLPRNAYLDNASVSGARWYPFSDSFHPTQPVFLGIAPSYDDYCGMGWYPNMFFYGGYYNSFGFGLFTPTLGLFINIGGSPYYGWGGYESYFGGHPGFYRTGYYHPYVYAYAGRQYWGGRTFRGYGGGGYAYNHGGYGGYGANRGFGGGGYGNGGRTFYGAGRPYNTDAHSFGDDRSYGGGHNYNADRTYGNENANGNFGNRNGVSNKHQFGAGGYQGGRTFRGAGGSYNVQGNDRFNNAGVGRSQSQGNEDNTRTYGGGTHTYAGQSRTFNSGFGGGGTGGGFQGGTRTFSNAGNERSFGHAFNGNGESAPRQSSASFSGGSSSSGFRGAVSGGAGNRGSFSGGGNQGGGGGGHR